MFTRVFALSVCLQPCVSPCIACQCAACVTAKNDRVPVCVRVCVYCVKGESCVNARSRKPTAFPSQVLINIRLPLVYL